jgi:hypothetical protein
VEQWRSAVARARAEPAPTAAALAGAVLLALVAAVARSPGMLWLALAYLAAGLALTWALSRAVHPLLRTLALTAGLAFTATLLVGFLFDGGLALLPSAVLWLVPLRGASWESEQTSLVAGGGLLAGLFVAVLLIAVLPPLHG